jgi:hypothetical protein
MLHSRRQHQEIPNMERICLPERLEDDLTFENVDAHRPIGVVGWEITARRQSHDRETKQPFLDERSRASPVTRHQGLIDRLLVPREMAN